ncbi:hypothetical protein [Novacetimonas hansenii]|uniref:Uncharacterized protein n=1 Tax=Novacetimonas hansenii TaxID=436 RepID=A0ABQ0SGS4_NOVHA|nr:hypothetical protein [Novacetimonas hansenii]GAN84049.1 hypothetical protein Gaha_0122_049 [Novacetimonas hansenii JCM 7643]GBQ55876.1 hypothetical protein AA0243_1037 [Novacetimonas hansenii NRIC 0243]GEC64574.1 hypothetical protein GHA01_24230 [Novacetimonas hansenii]
MEIETFFEQLIEHTSANFKKIPTDIYRLYSKTGTLTEGQAKWIKSALTRNKKLRELDVPEEITLEIGIALKEKKEVELTPEIQTIMLEELANAVSRIIQRIQ